MPLIGLICSLLQKSPENEVKAIYSSYIIELFSSTDPIYTKNEVNTMHNECIIERICSFVQELPKNDVKAIHIMHN